MGQAIAKGAGSKDFFGTAYGQSGDKFDGFKFGDDNVQLDDTLLLIEPEAATAYEKAQQPDPTPPGPTPPGPTPPGPTPPGQKARAFYGSIEINPATAKMRLVQAADEIISLLASDPQSALKITVEINAEFPEGASDQIKRAVSENATSLEFGMKTWE